MIIDSYRFGAPSGAHPLAYLFSGGKQGAIYDPKYAGGAFTDTAGTTPATTDGQLVARATDFSGNGNHLLQGTSGFRPLFKTSGGKAWLLGDGADDSMLTAGNVPGIKFVCVATRYGAATFVNYNGLICTQDNASGAILFVGDFSATNAWYTTGANLTNFRLNGSASGLAPMNTDGVCSVEKTAGNSAPTAPIRLFIDRNNASRHWNGRLYGAFLLDQIPSAGDRNTVEAYMATLF